ncbi:MAG TPA: 16S rRNA (guanine(527)-N(7))-methyltransferase RsmG [Candidatus Baltobacteraceae bacterium]|nr:16S rRNA (guanine(527)-N(7))-methyltransferase RsmG [Candidatus Baltobacteraceae bacterium]
MDAPLAARLAQFGAMLLDANRSTNLTGAQSAQDLAEHLLDSLTLVPYVTAPLADVGSGGGLPAIVLAIATGVDMTLIEATRKKAAFLQRAARELDVRATVLAQRAELAAHDAALRGAFGSATARAVSSAPTVLELTLPFLRPGGRALLQRGALDAREREAVADAAPMLGGRLAAEVPLEGERRILIVEKIAPTPARFPRRPGIPEKRPLCY